MYTVVPSDNLSLGFLIVSNLLVPLYKRHTPPRCTRVCVCSLSLSRLRGALSLATCLSLSRSPRIALEACLGLTPLDCSRLLSRLSPLFSHRPLTPFITITSTKLYTCSGRRQDFSSKRREHRKNFIHDFLTNPVLKWRRNNFS